MRKLATIQRIESLSPIPDADSIEVAQVLGWKVVVRKGEFKVNDICVYCEIDSILPERPEFEFLRNSKFRIRTIRLRGQISQGICFPITILPDELQWHIQELEAARISHINGAEGAIGMDVTEILGIEKYEPPIPAELDGIVKNSIPSFIPKSDEDRIQIIPKIVNQYAGKKFVTTEKLDGSSSLYYWYNGMFGVCGRRWEYYESSTNSFWRFAKENSIKEKLEELGKNIALQGEIIGEGIQKNRYRLKGQTVKFFRVFDIDEQEYLPYDKMVELIHNLKLETVPIIDMNYILPATIDEILEYANGKSLLNPETEREGIVFVRFEKQYQGRLSFKAVSNKFLIKNKE